MMSFEFWERAGGGTWRLEKWRCGWRPRENDVGEQTKTRREQHRLPTTPQRRRISQHYININIIHNDINNNNNNRPRCAPHLDEAVVVFEVPHKPVLVEPRVGVGEVPVELAADGQKRRRRHRGRHVPRKAHLAKVRVRLE